jgi:ATP adenylyltransferase
LKTKSLTNYLQEDIWPSERDLLIRPERMKYIRKLIKPKGCVFCRSAKHKMSVDTLTVCKTKYSQVVLNKFPYNTGHILVIPQRHCGDITQLKEKEYLDLMLLLKNSIEIVQKIYECSGMNVGINLGKVAGAGIPDHMHIHVIPRWSGDVNFFPMIAETKVIVESVEDTYLKLSKAFAKLNK